MNNPPKPSPRSSARVGACKAGSWRSVALLLGTCVVVLAGCRGDRSDQPPRQFFPDLEDTPRWNPQAGSEFFPDGRTMRPPVDGTVAHSRWAYHEASTMPEPFNAEREDLLREDDGFYRGQGPDGQVLERIPVRVDEQLILRGQERFNIYCAACHGYVGDGQGMVGLRWSAPVPSLHDPRFTDPALETGRDGHIFRIAREGVVRPDGTPSMPPYGHALSHRDAWAVVAYVRVLQESHQGTLDDVPANRREQLLEERARMPIPSPEPGPGQGPAPSPDAPPAGTPAVTPPARGESPDPQPDPRQNP
jgi:mono/diheme cytochrome c family protein